VRRLPAANLACALLALAAPLAAQQPASPPDSVKPADSTAATTLVREVFAYEGGGRDPFVSLLKSGDVRPLIADLKLVSVLFDGVYPARSVAVLRDVITTRRYRVKQGDIVGRLKITQIRPREVVFTVQEFGYERQQTLQLTKREETP
jgi:hypothetical protein